MKNAIVDVGWLTMEVIIPCIVLPVLLGMKHLLLKGVQDDMPSRRKGD